MLKNGEKHQLTFEQVGAGADTGGQQDLRTPLRFQNSFSIAINPISAGVLENQDMLGGGQFDPPAYPGFCKILNNQIFNQKKN